jgi:hypothetical protein
MVIKQATLGHLLQRRRTALIVIFASLLVLRSRVFTIPLNIVSELLKKATRRKPLTPQELAQALQQLYVKRKDGAFALLVPVRNSYVAEVRLRVRAFFGIPFSLFR